MISRDPFPIDNPDIRLQKLALGESIAGLFDSKEQSHDRYDSMQSTHTFIDESFLHDSWMPDDIARFLIQVGASIKSIDVCHDVEPERPRPLIGIVLMLDNGERITLSKDPTDLRTQDFVVSYSDSAQTLPDISSDDVGLLMISLLFAKNEKPDVTTARMLTQAEFTRQSIDPTDPVISRYALQLLDLRADSWKKEITSEYYIEDDKNGLRMVRTLYPTNDEDLSVTFEQKGTEISDETYFEMTATITRTKDGQLYLPTLEFERFDSDPVDGQDPYQRGSADQEPHLYDFMKAVTDNAKDQFDVPISQISLEQRATNIEQDDADKRRYDP